MIEHSMLRLDLETKLDTTAHFIVHSQWMVTVVLILSYGLIISNPQ